MHPPLSLRLASQRCGPCVTRPLLRRPFATSPARRAAEDSVQDQADAAKPAPSPSDDASNPALRPYPSATGPLTTSTATPDTTTPEPSARRPPAGDPTSALSQSLSAPLIRRTSRGPPTTHTSSRLAFANRTPELRMTGTRIAAQQPRQWTPGDVYAPHDLTSTEALKTKRARGAGRVRDAAPPSRAAGGPDALEALGVDPLREYKNFAMMGDFVTDMGRIKSRAMTGLKMKSQRRLAKAVRRAVGLGLVPSVHRHPELFQERMEQKGYQESARGWSGV